jgi:hypothetical protein
MTVRMMPTARMNAPIVEMRLYVDHPNPGW